MNMVRFIAYDNDTQVAQTDWTPEQTRECAGKLLSAFRQQYPNLAYRIEREGDSKIPNRQLLTRATIRDGSDTYYSRWFTEPERDERMNEIREKWPKADIVTETRNG